ncbi:HD-GYP domain-containing protein [Paenibacillus sp. WLX2291]|uniref:HD-GYP domain-containing protein n=1 Tax=Paenibacillus sp. WLX2291 TaxID=3296934 RepID=UPI0039843503
MVLTPVSELKPGTRLNNDVFTEKGNLLLPKGKMLLPRDLTVLQAFLIEAIDNERPAPPAATDTPLILESTTIKRPERVSFEQSYTSMVHMIKQCFQSALAQDIPVYKLRTGLEQLISHSRHYNILTFYPAQMKQDEYIYHNALLTSLTSYRIAKWMGVPENEGMQVALAGLFHDIGNIRVDPDILYKPSRLEPSELDEMRRHTLYGYEILKKVTGINEGVRLAALQHHEKVDGSGYPLRLDHTRIHVYARIVAVADIFHAMTLSKNYRKAQSPYLVLEQLESESFGKLDPAVVTTFIRKVTQFHNGTSVRLSNGAIGKIVFSDRDHPTRPMVAVNETIYNLIENRKLHIQSVLQH